MVAFLAEMAYGYSRLGYDDDARRLYAEVEEIGADRSIGARTWGIANLAIGRHEEALEWLGPAAALESLGTPSGIGQRH